MRISDKELEDIRKELTDAGVAKAKAEANYQVALAKLKVASDSPSVVIGGGDVQISSSGELQVSKGTVDTKEETEKSAPKPSKPATPSKPPKTEEEESQKKPAKPPKPSKPQSPPKPSKPESKEEESSEEYTFEEYSSDMLARDAKDKIRELTDEEDSKAKIFAFIKGTTEIEDRTTVLGVAETHIGEAKVAELKDLTPQEEEEEAEEKPAKPTPPKPSKPKAPSKPKKESKEEVDETIDDLKDDEAEEAEPEDAPTDQKVSLPDGVDRPEGAPACFGNADVYDQDSHKCMVCVFDFECEKAQEAIAEA